MLLTVSSHAVKSVSQAAAPAAKNNFVDFIEPPVRVLGFSFDKYISKKANIPLGGETF